MKKLKNNIGVTLAEVLIVVAIIGILGGVAIVSVWNYQRSLGQVERDGVAKEIFIAAQNHLTAVYGEGYLGLGEADFGTEDTISKDKDGKDIVDDYYYVVNGGTSGAGVFDQMLPFGAVDETVRVGGSYIIHYQRGTGMVLDVFYCTTGGSPAKFNHSFFGEEENYNSVINKAGEDNKSARRTYEEGGDSILGWYGGTEAASLPSTSLEAPTIVVKNEEKLYVDVRNPNGSNSDARLKLIITGVDSKAQKAYELKFTRSDSRVKCINNNNFTVILDDITTSGMHFGDIDADTEKIDFIPGENVEIQAVAYSTTALAKVQYSSKVTTNSLFGSINKTQDTAYIGNIRHLENLDKAISNLDANDTSNKLKISKAEQTNDFGWITFQKAVLRIESKNTLDPPSESSYGSVGVYDFKGNGTQKSGVGYYMPIDPDDLNDPVYVFSYNGKNHSISDVAVDTEGDAGLFGSVSDVTSISNLELIDFSIKGTTSAGALAGTVKDCAVTNVLARCKDNSAASTAKKITATTDAGGLIGNLQSGTVLYSAAAVVVGDPAARPANAGGLIGKAGGTITGCYSGGHTKSGSYEEWVKTKPYDVTGATAGGLVGSSGATIQNSYSTCSVSGTSKAGGFAGAVTAGGVSNCYAAGLIDQSQTAAAKYAFIANGTPTTFTGNYYYQVINEVPSTKANAREGETEPMLPYPNAGEISNHLGKAAPLDLSADSYNDFTGALSTWNTARAFDSALVKYYSGKYTLKSVDDLQKTDKPTGYDDWNQLFVSAHYGDWPSPEVFYINN